MTATVCPDTVATVVATTRPTRSMPASVEQRTRAPRTVGAVERAISARAVFMSSCNAATRAEMRLCRSEMYW
jgi:hypothetical protein